MLTLVLVPLMGGVIIHDMVAPYRCAENGPLRALNGGLVDVGGRHIHLAGINWFGFETQSFAPEGLLKRNYQDMLNQIASLGFNTLRLPYSNQLFDASSQPTGIDYTLNPELRGLHGLALLDRIVAGARTAGLCVILDQHRPDAYAQSELWYTPKLSESRWLGDWVMLASHFRHSPLASTLIGADLHNEPRGPATWGDGNLRTDWRLAAERGGNAILGANPDWLIFVEGIEHYQNDYYWWGGNLEGARQFPVRLSHPDKLVYSAHDYGPELYPQGWFQQSDFARGLPAVWRKHWAYLQQDGIAPVHLGEFGGRSVGTDAGGQWQRTLARYVEQNGFSYTYWSWTPNSQDTGGLLENDWKTVDPAKLSILPYLR